MEKELNSEEYERRILSTKETIEAIILRELPAIIDCKGAPYIKFLLFSPIIEFLGACLDSERFTKEGLSETRFNKGMELLPTKYKGFKNTGSGHYMYEGFRCNMVHRLVPHGFTFTTRDEARDHKNVHLKEDVLNEGKVVLVLEDFAEDIQKGAKKLLKMYDQGKAPKAKGDEPMIKVTGKKPCNKEEKDNPQ